MAALTLGATIVAVILWGETAREALYKLLGIRTEYGSRCSTTVKVLGILVSMGWFFTQHPFWAAFATAQLVAVGSKFALLAALVITAAASTLTWPTGKALSATVLARRRRVDNSLVRCR